MDTPYELSVESINERWARPENIDDWSQLVIKHTEDTVEYITEAPPSGIWKKQKDGTIKYDRMDTHRRAVEKENEAFFLRITGEGDYLYEGADVGILVMRGRLMTDDFKLTKRAKDWITAIQDQYKTTEPASTDAEKEKIAEIAGFKMM
jgi:hypothetical protein